MKVDVRHAEASDGDLYPLGPGRLLDRFSQLIRCPTYVGIPRFFQIEDIVDMGFRGEQGVAWITGVYGQEGQEILGLPCPMRRFNTLDDLTEYACCHKHIVVPTEEEICRSGFHLRRAAR